MSLFCYFAPKQRLLNFCRTLINTNELILFSNVAIFLEYKDGGSALSLDTIFSLTLSVTPIFDRVSFQMRSILESPLRSVTVFWLTFKRLYLLIRKIELLCGITFMNTGQNSKCAQAKKKTWQCFDLNIFKFRAVKCVNEFRQLCFQPG